MRWLLTYLVLAVHGISIVQAAMPASIYEDLDVRDGMSALAIIKADRALVNSLHYDDRQTPLHVAAVRGHTEVVRWLVTHGADVNARCYNDFSPLLLAANSKIAETLLKAGAKTEVHSAFGATPLQYAAFEGVFGQVDRMDVAKVIIKSGATLDLSSAVMLQMHDAIRSILRAHPEAANEEGFGGRWPLHFAARNGDIQTVRLLLKSGANIDAGTEPGMNYGSGRFTALVDAIWAGKEDIAVFLCQQGANPNIIGERAVTRSGMSPRLKAVLAKYAALRPRK